MYQIITLYILSFHDIIWQLYLNGAGKASVRKEGTWHLRPREL